MHAVQCSTLPDSDAASCRTTCSYELHWLADIMRWLVDGVVIYELVLNPSSQPSECGGVLGPSMPSLGHHGRGDSGALA